VVLFGYGLLCRNRSLAGFERDDPRGGSYTKPWDGTPNNRPSRLSPVEFGRIVGDKAVAARLAGDKTGERPKGKPTAASPGMPKPNKI
jgi:hypothetical protein